MVWLHQIASQHLYNPKAKLIQKLYNSHILIVFGFMPSSIAGLLEMLIHPIKLRVIYNYKLAVPNNEACNMEVPILFGY